MSTFSDLNRPLGQLDSAHSLSVVLASDYTLTVTATNPSVSTTGTAVPASGTYVAGINNSGNLTGLKLTAANNLLVDGSTVTQPISAVSLPLPTGAATAAKQPALGTAGAASTDVLTIQGIASMVALKVDGSAVTQPVSGTFWQATQPVSAASLPLPSGAATSAKQPALGTAGTPSTDVLTVQGAATMTALKVDGSAVTQPVSAASLPLPTGAATSALQTTGNTSLSSLDTKTPSLGQTTMSGSRPVVIASNQSAIATTLSGVDYNTGAASSTTQRVSEAGRASAWLARNDYTSTGVTTGAYVTLVASTAAATTRLRIFDSSGSAMILATGAAASEVNQLYIPPGGWDGPVELYIASGTRVSLKALDVAASTGQIVITALS